MTSRLEAAFERLAAHYGARPRQTAETPLAALLMAVLGAGPANERGRQAVENLREAGVTDASGLCELAIDELIELIDPAAHAGKKAARLHSLARFVVERYEGSIEKMFEADAETLRSELLALSGIGPETADSILLFAARRPSFVVDLAVHRVLKRHGWIEFEADSQTLKEYVESGFDRDSERLAEFHDLLDLVGRQHCRKTALCDGCPLAELLPAGGPLAPEF